MDKGLAALALAPPSALRITTTSWPAGLTIHRVHHLDYGAVQFNPGPKGNARFSPIADANGKPIPTLYGGASFACAAMESVFHDVPFWTSRQDDSARAVVLFGDRIADGLLKPGAATRSLVNDPPAYGELLALAEQIGVGIVPGKS